MVGASKAKAKGPSAAAAASAAAHDIPDSELVNADLKALQAQMVQAGYSLDEMEETKVRRRRLHNRLSARLSASRRQNKHEAVVRSNERLRAERKELRERVAELEDANEQLLQQVHDARASADAERRAADALRREIEKLYSEEGRDCWDGNGSGSVGGDALRRTDGNRHGHGHGHGGHGHGAMSMGLHGLQFDGSSVDTPSPLATNHLTGANLFP
mmetsp:Transcript_9747/g.29486  ORF Transcript_9747/g.29486 Transcript_9747/m.29486 type:complete len:215 (+) Transcript_9747:361-1005(+)